jgi:hypothetical protein
MGTMIRSVFPEPHFALLRLIEYANGSKSRSLLVRGIVVMIPFYVMAQLCSSVLGFAEFYSCQWDDTMPTLHSGIQLEPAVAQLVLVQDMHSSNAAECQTLYLNKGHESYPVGQDSK